MSSKNEYENETENRVVVKVDLRLDRSVKDYYVDNLRVEALERQIDREFGLSNEDESDEDLEICLNGSELGKLSQFRQALGNSDEVALPESGVYFDALEARITGALNAAIEAGEVEAHGATPAEASEVHPVILKSLPRRRGIAVRAGQFALLAGVALLMTSKWLSGSASGTSGSNLLKRATQSAAPEVLTGTVMSFESTADLALEIAARRLVAYHQAE